eukprot:307955-Chlamydomonas_euryale.AAC.6
MPRTGCGYSHPLYSHPLVAQHPGEDAPKPGIKKSCLNVKGTESVEFYTDNTVYKEIMGPG